MIATGREAGLGLAQRLLDLAADEGATEAEALVIGTDSQLTRFANSEIHQNVAERDVAVNLRFVDGKRIGVASTNRLDEASLRRLAARAATSARLQPEHPDFAGLPPAGPTPLAAGAASAGTAESTPEQRAEAAREVVGRVEGAGLLGFGSFATSLERVAVANSHGLAVEEARTFAQLITVAMAPGGEGGYAEACAVDATAIDARAVGEEAAQKCTACVAPGTVPPGEYPVVLEPYAVIDLLGMLGYVGFSALAVQEERSFFEPGRVVGSELVTIVDDGMDPAGAPASFDYEGVAKQRVALIERGVCRDVVYDAQTAARAGRASTGHGLPAPNPWGPFPLNMLMDAGTASREELLGGLDRGLLVTRFHYTNPVHPKLAIVTGMTRDGLFLVEGGKIRGPVRNLRFTQSYLQALAGVQAVSAERRLLRGDLGAAVVPSVRIAGFTFTGATEH
ncbi:MAG TPA: TldD/PmbA family protein [Candidatus Limnocylindrales bacterium]|nr:TldD/PmbA family protein [Candidatus Limnocylindrales bacterium]